MLVHQFLKHPILWEVSDVGNIQPVLIYADLDRDSGLVLFMAYSAAIKRSVLSAAYAYEAVRS